MTEFVDDTMRCLLCSRAEMHHWHEFGERVEHDPQPEDVCSFAQVRTQFVELEMGQQEMSNEVPGDTLNNLRVSTV